MTTKDSTDLYTITTSMDLDPEINYFGWRLNVEDVAAGAATLIVPTGLLTTVMTDPEWNAYPANTSTTPATANAAAQTTIAARPVEPTHKTIVSGMTGPQIAVIKYGNDRHEIWHLAKEQLKASIIKSLGDTLAGTVAPPPHGFKMMNIQDIMIAVGNKYSTVDWTSLNKMEEIMMTPLDNVAHLDSHIARLTRHINMSEAAGFEVVEHRRVKLFRQSVQHHHQIARTLTSYDEEHTNPKTHTYAMITTHVRVQLPPILSAAGAGKAFHVGPDHEALHAELTVAYAALQNQHNDLKGRRNSGKTNRSRSRDKNRDKRKPQTGTDNVNKAKTTGKCDHYCYVHGHQNSHSSAQCKVMDSDKQTFTSAMRAAKTRGAVKGGSTAVRGRQATIETQAFMATTSDSEDSGTDTHRSTPPRSTSEDEPRYRTVRTAFYDDVYHQGQRGALPAVFALGSPGETANQADANLTDRVQEAADVYARSQGQRVALAALFGLGYSE